MKFVGAVVAGIDEQRRNLLYLFETTDLRTYTRGQSHELSELDVSFRDDVIPLVPYLETFTDRNIHGIKEPAFVPGSGITPLPLGSVVSANYGRGWPSEDGSVNLMTDQSLTVIGNVLKRDSINALPSTDKFKKFKDTKSFIDFNAAKTILLRSLNNKLTKPYYRTNDDVSILRYGEIMRGYWSELKHAQDNEALILAIEDDIGNINWNIVAHNGSSLFWIDEADKRDLKDFITPPTDEGLFHLKNIKLIMDISDNGKSASITKLNGDYQKIDLSEAINIFTNIGFNETMLHQKYAECYEHIDSFDVDSYDMIP